jgi:hypothetical protein
MQNPKSKIHNSGAFATLRQFVRERAPSEQCELCSIEVAAEHQHLIDPVSRRLLCCCEACAILFSGQESARYRRVPRRIRALADFRMSDAQWDSLMIPISLAFFFHSTPAERVVALYPSPAGATESLLDLASWEDLARDNPMLERLEPDVEALLVNRMGSARLYYIAPIDECYKLVGLIRMHWRGLSGGTEAWAAIGQFFASLDARA